MTYYSYYLYFESNPNKGYVGITRNLKRRLIQHKSEAKANITKKHRWINKYIVTENLSIKVIKEYNSWEDACLDEVLLIKEYENLGYILTNLAPGGEGNNCPKGIVPSNRKEYVVIKDAKVTYIKGLLNYCKENGLSHGNLHNCLKGKLRHAQGYIVFFKEEWDMMDWRDKENLLDNYYAYIAKEIKSNHLQAYVKHRACLVEDIISNSTYTFNTVDEGIKFVKCSIGSFYNALKKGHTIKSKYKVRYIQ